MATKKKDRALGFLKDGNSAFHVQIRGLRNVILVRLCDGNLSAALEKVFNMPGNPPANSLGLGCTYPVHECGWRRKTLGHVVANIVFGVENVDGKFDEDWTGNTLHGLLERKFKHRCNVCNA